MVVSFGYLAIVLHLPKPSINRISFRFYSLDRAPDLAPPPPAKNQTNLSDSLPVICRGFFHDLLFITAYSIP